MINSTVESTTRVKFFAKPIHRRYGPGRGFEICGSEEKRSVLASTIPLSKSKEWIAMQNKNKRKKRVQIIR